MTHGFNSERRATLVAFLAIAIAGTQTPADAQGTREATLVERLTFGLQARRPQEIAFVEAVVDTVGRGKLPLSLVDRTFFWARKRAPSRGGEFLRRPIIYFQPAIEIQAKRLGITIRRDGHN